MRSVLTSRSEFPIELKVEHADYSVYPEDQYIPKIVELLRYKYARLKFDMVFEIGDETNRLLPEYGEQLFGKIPKVYVTIDRQHLTKEVMKPDVTSLLWGFDLGKSIEIINDILPQCKHLYVVSGASVTDMKFQKLVQKSLDQFDDRFNIITLYGLDTTNLLDKVANLPEDSAILYIGVFRDGKGKNYIPRDMLSNIAERANAPIFGFADTFLGHGIVGGALLSAEHQGKRYANVAINIFSGTSLDDSLFTAKDNLPIFDWRQLKRWGIDEDNLPQNSIVRYKERSFLELYKWYAISALVIFLLQGLLLFLVLISRKKHQRSEKLLRDSHVRHKAFMENSVEAIWCVAFEEPIDINLPQEEQFELVYKHGYIAEANDVYAQSVGLQEGRDLVGKRIETFFPLSDPNNVATLKDIVEVKYLKNNAETVETYPDGVSRVFLNNMFGVFKDDNLLEKIWGTHIDITERKKLEDELSKAERKYRTVADYTYDWEYWESPDGSLLYVSPSCKRITGYSTEEFIECPELLSDIILPEDRGIWDNHQHGAKPGTEQIPSQIEFRIQTKKGHIRWVAHVCLEIHNEQGEFEGVRSSNRDITQLRDSEQEIIAHRELLIQQDRRNRLGQLAGSIAHELNQPLTGILSDAQAGELLLEREELDKTQIREIFVDIVADTKRASLIIRNLRGLYNNKNKDYISFNLNRMITETLRILHSEFISQGVTINTDLYEKLPDVNADRIQLQQVLINLINNSLQALQHSENRVPRVSVSTSLYNDTELVVCVDDNGPGIEPDRLTSIFQPLVSTKEKGMGMGLAICNSIIKAHGGRIWAKNNPNGGVSFYFTAPARR